MFDGYFNGEQIIKLQERGLWQLKMIMQLIYRISVHRLGEYWHSMQDDKKRAFV
jgi:hypothetical protein